MGELSKMEQALRDIYRTVRENNSDLFREAGMGGAREFLSFTARNKRGEVFHIDGMNNVAYLVNRHGIATTFSTTSGEVLGVQLLG
jgi:hypothetical protein